MDDHSKILELAKPIAEAEGLELVDLQVATYGASGKVRVFLDKPSGVTVGDCSRFSRLFDPVLEAEGLMDGRYTLEVSSPGVDKPLQSKRDYERNLGRRVRVTYFPTPGETRSVEGSIEAADEVSVTLGMKKESLNLPFESIHSAKIQVEF